MSTTLHDTLQNSALKMYGYHHHQNHYHQHKQVYNYENLTG